MQCEPRKKDYYEKLNVKASRRRKRRREKRGIRFEDKEIGERESRK